MNGTLAAGFLGEDFLEGFFLDAGFLGGADFLATGLFFALFETGTTSSSSDSLSSSSELDSSSEESESSWTFLFFLAGFSWSGST